MTSSPEPPDFRNDGYLPVGIHPCDEKLVLFRFGSGSRRRRWLTTRLRRWIELGRAVGAKRLLIDGSFVTAKVEPNDIDVVIYLPSDFGDRVRNGDPAAVELEEMIFSRVPEKLFAVDDDFAWDDWCEFFSRTRELDRRRKGLVKVER